MGIPAEKKDKVSFPTDVAAELLEQMEPHQLESRYGGTAPDLAPDETFPFRFFKNPRGEAALLKEHPMEFSNSGEGKVEDYSMHESTQLAFHEGLLWDSSSTAAAIGTTLEKVYCGRMVWLKIVNMPGGLGRIVNGLIPAEKKDKVSFPSDVAAELLEQMEPHQLESRYGGTAPDLAPDETYPFHFFKNPRGEAAFLKEHSM